MRFAFLKDHFRCCVESGLGVLEAVEVMRGDREGNGQIERFRVGVDRNWRLLGFVGRGRKRGGSRFPASPLGWWVVSADGRHASVHHVPQLAGPGGVDAGASLTPRSPACGSGLGGWVVAPRLLCTVSVPVNAYGTEGHKPTRTRTLRVYTPLDSWMYSRCLPGCRHSHTHMLAHVYLCK